MLQVHTLDHSHLLEMLKLTYPSCCVRTACYPQAFTCHFRCNRAVSGLQTSLLCPFSTCCVAALCVTVNFTDPKPVIAKGTAIAVTGTAEHMNSFQVLKQTDQHYGHMLEQIWHPNQIHESKCTNQIHKSTLAFLRACSAKLKKAGAYLVHAAMGDAAVSGSPLHLYVSPAAVDADR